MQQRQIVPVRHLQAEIERPKPFLESRDCGDEDPRTPEICPPIRTIAELRQQN